MKLTGYALVVAMLAVTTSASAQAPVEQATLRHLTVSPNTEVVLAPNDTLVTKSVKVGDKLCISTVFDVMQDGFVLIPRGTSGEATVTYRTGKGSFGKSGKMEVAFNYLDLNGRHIPLTGTYRQEGQGNTGVAVGAVVAVGVFGTYVNGHSATLVAGQ
ncbi:hypothetical protein [Novosphingobium rosa]|uniref:hypothetical protein n=1 Tax=Novosphingobium rosa TaxID=76978 RepID=UPI000831FFA6|nr:hypothetical protein [Novosphingobium rosa]